MTTPSSCIVKALSVGLALLVLLPNSLGGTARAQQTRQVVVVLDPGHGGPDSGAVDLGLMEKTLTLRVANAAASYLRAYGYRVFLTRSRDQGANTPPRDLNHDGRNDGGRGPDEYTARTTFANRHHADVFVSIHFDGDAGNSERHGTHGYYCPARKFWAKSLRLARLLTASVSSSLTASGFPSPNNGVETDVADKVPQTRADYPWFLVLGPTVRHFVTGSSMPGSLVETLYLTNPRDAAALRKAATIRVLGAGYARGVRAYFHGRSRI